MHKPSGEPYTPLGELIAIGKGNRNWDQMSDATGGVYGPKRFSQIMNNNPPLQMIPEPQYIRAIAQACGVSEWSVVVAAAETVGITVEREPSGFLRMIPKDADAELSDDQKGVILSILRQYIADNRARTAEPKRPAPRPARKAPARKTAAKATAPAQRSRTKG